MYRTVGSAAAVFLSVGGKMLVTVMYLFNGTEMQKEEQDKEKQGQVRALA